MHLERHQKISISLTILTVFAIWLVNGIYLAALSRVSGVLFWTADLIQWIALPAILLASLAKKAAVLPKHYGFDTSALRWQSPVLGTLGVFITAGVAFVVVRDVSWQLLGQPTGFFTFSEVYPSGPLGIIILFYSAATAGIVESIFFIGLPWLLYHNIKDTPSRTSFTLAASAIFASVHWEQGPHIAAAAFSFNIVACAWFFKLGTLWPVAAGHTFIDLVAFS